ncbi:hypothetical protein PPYR_04978 [Photinus pyralis]|uniref:Methyltransferase domain-containing protein n=1 Tax=Photinus pyralis TaxID=7054 RepID=A0A5N3ZY61_PHOPY|nr:juvenile hormone acid O-methyltransferase-like [Photinus pyralis]XP_031359361.1 juvenile hormone acid O-methyltransferase-like [Photinus pyralis]KAB0789997.1 hypothetical protein PPYR_15717 [Photinus pyralis]KAB0802792.1 hypothetical protein PPYR_04978 [Photinus pyralis]
MEKGESYVQYGVLSQQGAIEALTKLNGSLHWKENCKILDVGCGPGNVTYDYILPKLPRSTKEIIGIDISPDYIKYAELHYGKHPIFAYKLMDIVNGDVPNEYEQHFDYVVSFLCFQQFSNHKAAFEKIKRMLKSGGEMLCYFPTSTKSTELFTFLAKQQKWNQYLCNYEMHCSPYKDSVDVESDVRRFLTDMQFKIVFFNYEERHYEFMDKNLPSAVRAIAYESLKIPEDMYQQFQADAIKAFRDLNVMKFNENNEGYYDCFYKLVTFHIIKQP